MQRRRYDTISNDDSFYFLITDTIAFFVYFSHLSFILPHLIILSRMFVTSYSPYSSLLFLSLSLSLLRSSPSFTDSLYPKFPHFPLLSTHIVSPIHFSFFSPLRFSSLLHLSLNQVPNSESVQGGPMYTVNMDGIIRTLRHRTLHSIAVNRFGNLSARIVELLQRKK